MNVGKCPRRTRAKWMTLATLCGTMLALTVPAHGNGNTLRDYTLRPIIKLGQVAGDTTLPSLPGYRFTLGPVNDRGEFAFTVGPPLQRAFGAYASAVGSRPELLMRYARNTFTPIVVPDTAGPVGTWPRDLALWWGFSMNPAGNVVFTAARSGGGTILGTFVWDAATGQINPIAVRGMPVYDGMTFTQPGGFAPAINNTNELALAGTIKNAAGRVHSSLFFRGVDGKLQPVLLPDQPLSDGRKIQISPFARPSLNDAGMIAFLAQRQGDRENSAYVWEQGTITPVLRVGAYVPGPVGWSSSDAVTAISGVFLHPRNRTALLSAAVAGSHRQHGVYRVANSTYTAVAVPGRAMVGGGKFKSLQNVILAPTSDTICLGVSAASRSGEHVILATLEDNSTAAYRVDTSGRLWLIVKSGMTTPAGTITKVGMDSPASLNSSGQVILSVELNGSGVPTVVRLTQNSFAG